MEQENIRKLDDKEVFKQIESYVYDENKIVTYKWLSRKISVHPFVAREFLSRFFEEQKKQGANLCAAYLICGITKTSNGVKVHRYCIATKDDVNKVKQTMGQVASEQIYAIQQGKTLDLSSLYAADYAASDVLVEQLSKWKIISYKNARQRTDDEKRRLKIPPAKSADDQKSLLQAKKATSNTSNNVVKTPISSNAKQDEAKSSSSATPKIPSMFTKQSGVKKKEDNASNDGAKSMTNKKQEKGSKKGSMMMNYFTKENNEQAKSEKTTSEGSKEVKKNDKKDEASSTRVDADKANCNVQSKKPVVSSCENSKHQTPVAKRAAKKGKEKNSSGDFQSAKNKGGKQAKRRRIIAMSSSESEDDEEMESESPLPSPALEDEPMESDDEEPIPPTPVAQKTCTGKKLVTETYEDEEGFIVTKKVWKNVAETEMPTTAEEATPVADSKNSKAESDEKSSSKKGGSKEVTPKISPVGSGSKKQASLMSFFKKKETLSK